MQFSGSGCQPGAGRCRLTCEMGSYNRLKPYPTEYLQFVSAAVGQRLFETIGDDTGLHLGTAVDILGRAAGQLEEGEEGEVFLMGAAVAWGKMLGLGGMDDYLPPEGTQRPRDLTDDQIDHAIHSLSSVLFENGVYRSTWGTVLVIAAMDLVCQAREVIPPAVPKTVLLGAIAEGARARGGR